MKFLYLLLVFLSACATMSDVLKNKENGTAVIYDLSKEQAWKAAITVFRWEGADAIEEHKDEGYMLTSSGMNAVSAGAFMGAWIEPEGKRVKVTVVTKRKIATNIATTLTETTFHKRFSQAAEILKSGKTLPISPPEYKSEK
jgi:hypothetical protein